MKWNQCTLNAIYISLKLLLLIKKKIRLLNKARNNLWFKSICSLLCWQVFVQSFNLTQWTSRFFNVETVVEQVRSPVYVFPLFLYILLFKSNIWLYIHVIEIRCIIVQVIVYLHKAAGFKYWPYLPTVTTCKRNMIKLAYMSVFTAYNCGWNKLIPDDSISSN